jgi:hypothetical protein
MEINIEKLVAERIEDMDLDHVVKEIVGGLITKDVKESITKNVKEECLVMIRERINVILNGPVTTDDGWGKREAYPSFTDLFKKEMAARMNDSYEVKREIGKQVETRVKSIMDNQYKEVIEKIVNELTGSYLKKPA